ncbi:MAG: MerC domain-containing protein [Planctomycetota bacterium]|nr:MerC domain-containing protein [Planctomycetota bacterium]
MPESQHQSLLIPGSSPLVESSRSSWSDLLGVIASIACAIHCAAMPMVVSYLPLLGLEFLADESFHRWMAVICFVIALAAFIPGWRKHRKLVPASVGAFGLGVIAATAFFSTDCCSSCESLLVADRPVLEASDPNACTESCCQQTDTDSQSLATISDSTLSQAPFQFLQAGFTLWLTPLGGFLLVTGHLLNHRSKCHCECCRSEHPMLDDEEDNRISSKLVQLGMPEN